jgi:two-component system, NtrC family, response regulator GlrR
MGGVADALPWCVVATPETPITTPTSHGTAPVRRFRRFRIEVIDGPAIGQTWSAEAETCTIGSHHSNGLVLADPTVSRFHCEVTASGGRFRVRDLGSRNGTSAGDVTIADGLVGPGAALSLGHSRLRIAADEREGAVPASAAARFGGLVGSSTVMRELFARLERAAGSDATVLIQGETGTGKEGAAAALHAASARAAEPFVAIDCGAIPATLFEAELFGSEAGAYTGATQRRTGAFEEASGGTLFLDEVGELAPELQAKLLRAIETRRIRRLGARAELECDVRIIAATNRDLRERVNSGAFRADLYYRLAVLHVALPPLREHLADLPELVAHLLERLAAPPGVASALVSPEHVALLARCEWAGNVRELRNYLEQAIVFGVTAPAPAGDDDAASYEAARKLALDRFERDYVAQLLRQANGNVGDAARLAGVNRAYLYRLIRRHRPPGN